MVASLQSRGWYWEGNEDGVTESDFAIYWGETEHIHKAAG